MAEAFITIPLVGFGIYILCLALYRLFLSPLSHFPGPALAALTLWYEFYYDVILGGRYQYKIKELHKRYGPIIRISPYELHIDDPEFYDSLYVGASVRKTDKYKRSAHAFGNGLSAFGTVPHDLHRMRRGALNPLFSKKAVTELIPQVIEPKIEKLCRRLIDMTGTGAVVNLVNTYEALTLDIIMEYAFGNSLDHLSHPEFYPDWHFVMRTGSAVFHLGAQWPFIPKMLYGLPEWFIKISDRRMMVYAYVNNLLLDNLNHVRQQGSDFSKSAGHRGIFHSLLDCNLPPAETTNERLVQEATSLITAGSATTAMALSRITFELLSCTSKLETLCTELQQAEISHCGRPSLQQLEQLPYLGGVINEGLRLTYGTPHRLMRISPDAAIHYKSWTIPAGTPVGMSNMFMHDNADIFPSPRTFLPERWLGDQQERRALERYLVPFSRGSRRCVGMNLAWVEILLTLYALFRPGGSGRKMKLLETDIDDVEIKHDLFNAFPKADSRGIRVLIET